MMLIPTPKWTCSRGCEHEYYGLNWRQKLRIHYYQVIERLRERFWYASRLRNYWLRYRKTTRSHTFKVGEFGEFRMSDLKVQRFNIMDRNPIKEAESSGKK